MKSISRSHSLSWVSLFVCLLLHFSSALPQRRLSAEPRTPPHSHGAAPKTVAPATRRIAPKSINLPLFFEANKGQADSSVKFLTRSKGYTLFLTPTETVLAEAKTQFEGSLNGFATPPDSKMTTQAAVRMQLVGANSAPLMNGLEEFSGKVNYLIGNDPAKWHTGIALYSQVRAEQVYPGVDLLFHGDQNQLEYDFIVAPGADPSKIAFRIRGATRMEIDTQGDLVLRTAHSDFRMHKPVIYQTIASERRTIEGGFVRKGKREVAFRLGAYDRSQPLVIDPKIGFASFLGGNGVEVTGGFVVDNTTPSSPKLYVSGFTTDSATFPETSNVTVIGSGTSTTPVVGEVGFVAEIDPTASAGSLVYLTFIGGKTPFQSADTGCISGVIWLSLDETQASGVQPVLGGETNCSDYPTTTVINPVTAPTNKDFGSVVTRLTPTGNAIDQSALLGGNFQVSGSFVSVGNGGEVLIAGSTSATNLPVQNAYVSTLNNGNAGFADCYVGKLERSDLKATYLTYMNTGGGSTNLNASGCGAFEDSSGNILAGGNTVSATAFNLGGVNLANGFEPNFPATATEVTWAAKLNPGLSLTNQLVFATYFGGGGVTKAANGAFDLGNGVVAIVGATTSNTSVGDIPLQNAYLNANPAAGKGGGQTGYFLLLDTSQTGAASLVCSTYFGGSGGADVISAVAYDAGDPTDFRIILGGQTSSTDFPTANAIQSYVGASGSPDGFVSVLGVPLSGQTSPANLVFSTYIGGANPPASINGTILEDDRITGVGVDANHTVYAVGLTNSAQGFFASTSPTTTVTGFQPTCTSCSSSVPTDDAVVFSIASGTAASGTTLQSLAVTPTSATIAAGQTQQFHAVGYYSDGTEQDITNSVVWNALPSGIAMMSSTTPGLATGVASGATNIEATQGGVPNLNVGALTVTGATAGSQGVAQVAPTSLNFGNQLVRTTSSTTPTVTLTNVGTGPLGSISIASNNSDYAIVTNNCPTSLAVGPPGCTFTVSFTPSIRALDVGAIVITDDATVGTTLVPLSGTGVGPVNLTPFETYFGSAQSPIPVGTPNGPQTVTLSNQSGGAITVDGISFTGNAAADFTQTNSTCPPSSSSLANGATCAIPVTFTPHGTGARTADVIVTLSSDVAFSQPDSSLTNLGGLTSISPSTPNAPVTAYDNFTLASASSITGIQWMGFQALAGQQCPSSPCIPAAIAQFQINFYSDASGSPGTLLASNTISGNANQTQIGTGTYSTETGLPVYSYSANLSSPFAAQSDTTYWVSIVPTQPFPPYWAWLVGTGGDGTSAQSFNGSTTLQPLDLAFSLTTGQSGQTSQTYSSHLIGNSTILQLPGFTANQLAANDDGSTDAVTLPFSVNFFGTSYNQLFVNNNGNVTFGQPFGTFTPTGLNTANGGIPIIAAYWADVDTDGTGSGLLTYGTDTVNGHQAFGVDWQDVGYFASKTDKLNSFQLILIDRSDTGAGNFDIEFNYNKIQWEAGDVSGGSDGLCTDPTECAAVGYSNGSGTAGTNFQLAGSFTSGALLDTNMSTGLIYNSLPAPGTTAVPGQYVFQVRGGSVQDADLALTMSQSANPVAPGQQEIYTLTVTNAGPADATSVVVTDTLPANATLLSSTFSGGTCTGTTTLTCNLGTIAANSAGSGGHNHGNCQRECNRNRCKQCECDVECSRQQPDE